jgi:hypothetical protein
VAKTAERPHPKGDAMLRKTSCLLALVFVCGVGRAGEPIPDDARFVGHTQKATVELVGVTYRPNLKSRWWRPDGTSAEIVRHLRQEQKGVGVTINWGTSEERFLPNQKFDNSFHAGRGRKVVTFLIRVWNPSTEQSSYGDGYDRSTADTSRPANDLPIERPSDGQYRHDDSADDVLPLVFGFKPWGPSPEVDYVAGVRTGVTSQRKNIFAPESGSDESLKVNAAIALSQITGKRHPLVPEGYGGPNWPRDSKQ